MIFSNITLLPIDNPHAVATDIGIAFNHIPVTQCDITRCCGNNDNCIK